MKSFHGLRLNQRTYQKPPPQSPQECLSDDTALVLANELYFKGAWDRIFDATKTEYKDFHLLNGQIAQVPLMSSKAQQKHLDGCFDGYKILKIAPKRSRVHAILNVFLTSDARDGLYILIQIFRSSPEFYEKHNLQEEDLPNFWTPRFKFPFKFEASGTMKELGKVLPFSLVGGFSEMVDSPGSLVLSKVFHESSIQVNEKGTEAAASTAPRFINYVAGCILQTSQQTILSCS